MASGGRTVASESEGREPTVLQKRQKEANLLVVLIIGILELRTNERGIGQENEPNFRPAARDAERENSPGQGFVAEALRDIVVNYVCRDRADPLWQFGAG